MTWHNSTRFALGPRLLADRHYSRQKIGTPQFVKPGRCLVLYDPDAPALWVSTWPYPEYTHHKWPGAWECALFRNEGRELSSRLIRTALAATRAHWGDPPDAGVITWIDPAAIKNTLPGYCFRRAGFKRIGTTDKGYLVLRLAPHRVPPAAPAIGQQLRLE